MSEKRISVKCACCGEKTNTVFPNALNYGECKLACKNCNWVISVDFDHKENVYIGYVVEESRD